MDWALESLTHSSVDEVIFVGSPGLGDLLSETDWLVKGRVVINPEPQRGMASSILCGLETCSGSSNAVLIAHADMPRIGTPLVDRLIASWRAEPELIVAPRFKGRQGNPVILPRSFWGEIRQLQGDIGCKSILQGHSSNIQWLECEDDAILFDVDTELDLLNFRRWFYSKSHQ